MPVAPFTVTFAPLFSGTRSETLSFTDDAPNSPQVLNVNATAAPAFSVTSAAAALTAVVSAGQPAIFNLQLTPGVDFNGTVALTCSGAPVNATCQAPNSVVLNTGAPASVTVTVATSGAGFTNPEVRSHRVLFLGATALALASIYLVLVLMFFSEACWNPRNGVSNALHGGRADAIVALMLFVPLLLVLNGCGGVTAKPLAQSTSVITPSGTSIIVLTPTATSAAGKPLQLSTIQLTLVVN
jgi:hypothetical protein